MYSGRFCMRVERGAAARVQHMTANVAKTAPPLRFNLGAQHLRVRYSSKAPSPSANAMPCSRNLESRANAQLI